MPKRASINMGILAKDVRADVLAVGQAAHAQKTLSSASEAQEAQAELSAVVDKLRSLLDELDLGRDVREPIEENLSSLRRLNKARSPEPGCVDTCLKSLMSKLERVGTTAEQVLFSELIKTLAGILIKT